MAGFSFASLLAACFPVAPSPSRIFSAGDQPPVERAVSVDDVLAALMEATVWISANCAPEDQLAIAIKDRLVMRSVSPHFSPTTLITDSRRL